MKRFWTRSSLAMLLLAAPFIAPAQEPAVDVLKPVDVRLPNPEPTVDPTEALSLIAGDIYTLASGDVITWKAAEPDSPADSLNAPTQPAVLALTTQAAAPARDAFEERIARLEAQVAALAAQLRSNATPTMTAPVDAAPRIAMTRTAPATAAWRTTTVAPAAPQATYSYSLSRTPQPAAPRATTARTATASGGPIVIHIYVHGASGSPAAAAPPTPATYYYQVTPPAAPGTTAPARVRAVAPTMGVRSIPAVTPPPAAPATPPPTFYSVPLTPTTPAIPAVPATPAAPALPGVPGAPAAVPVPPPSPPNALPPAGALSTVPASRIAWDDIPGDKE